MNTGFNLLDQTYTVKSLLDSAVAAYNLLPDDTPEKNNLYKSLKNFEETIVQICWHVDDIKEVDPNISDEKAIEALNILASFDLNDSDWFTVQTAIDQAMNYYRQAI